MVFVESDYTKFIDLLLVPGDFMSETHEYDDITDLGVIRTFIMDKLDEYNRSPGVIRLNLVLFQFAIEHITRMTRVISQPRGHLLLVGLGKN
jgi:hypothetical protein